MPTTVHAGPATTRTSFQTRMQANDLIRGLEELLEDNNNERVQLTRLMTGLWAQTLREVLPNAASVSFTLNETYTAATLLLIRNQLGSVVWASDFARERGNPAAAWQRHTKRQTSIDPATVADLQDGLAGIYNTSGAVFEFGEDEALAGVTEQLTARLDINKALAFTSGHLPIEQAVVLEAVANAGGSISGADLTNQLGNDPLVQPLTALTNDELLAFTEDGFALTRKGLRALARKYNTAAVMLPPDPTDVGPLEPFDDGGGTLPAIQLAGMQVYLYVDDAGIVRVSLHLDGGDEEIPAWLNPGSLVPVRVEVNDTVVYNSDPAAWKYTEHNNSQGTYCRWSACAARDQSRLIPGEKCPFGCPDSGVEPAED